MNTKYLIMTCALVAGLAAIPAFTSDASARGHGYGGHMGGGYYQNVTPEQQAAMSKLQNDHYQKMSPIREQLWAKQTELNALSGNPAVKPDDIRKLVAEVSALRAQMDKERMAFRDQMSKETGVTMGMGGGRGMMGGDCPMYDGGPRGGGDHRGGGHRGGGHY